MNIPITQLPIWERPREKIMEKGVEALSNAEVLAVLLGSGTRSQSALFLAQELLTSLDKGLHQLEEMTIHELMEFPGIGPAKASRILCGLEIARRAKTAPLSPMNVSSPGAVYSYMLTKMQNYQKEVFICLHLDSKNNILSEDVVSIGTLNRSLVHPREVFKKAVKNGAASVLVVHNHPSGDPKPSEEDKQVTKRLKEVGELLGIPLLDHVIIAREERFSFREAGIF
ncbi:MAG: DNA repair protein RadC [Tissierellia bacterium]|nr:DNA repair protein RadC [Tissierellia bacterium]